MNSAQAALENLLIPAIRSTLDLVKSTYPKHHFYYFALTTTGEILTPGHSFWSTELLEKAAIEAAEKQGSDPAEMCNLLRFSYADSPLFYIGEPFFGPVNEWFLHRPGIDELCEKAWEEEADLRLGAMINSLQKLIDAGDFGTGKMRELWFLNVEINPPDGSNYDRALQLNSPSKVEEWLQLGGE
ncbi:DUF4303 domain-containing protein [Pseudoflavitalea sp. G-6-1-2]|uniref:DUF4303 domain-containing protein n=1 Tax=Pseudoflavitalea sp. G-6-1-2 TaxID=2728841 RepID=UPI00146C4BCA|nr:DUF4303 domain-containing protein [Pseudoflavitalea sp. G-6-1-2]NML23626.1 DUF4303 domain-containing protein [Pseudoflavitalea sp. G-6-1-2]